MEKRENDINVLMEKYNSQNSKVQRKEYDDEIRAEADLCAECCTCMRTCCIMSC